jgi:hypothetical protein
VQVCRRCIDIWIEEADSIFATHSFLSFMKKYFGTKFYLFIQAKMHKSILHISTARFSLKTLNPRGIRTKIFRFTETGAMVAMPPPFTV